MSFITIVDLEVFFRVGVTDEERAKPQRLLLTIDLKFDFASAAVSGRLARTIDYYEVAKQLKKLGDNRNWRLIESVAMEIAELRVLKLCVKLRRAGLFQKIQVAP